MPLTLPAGTQAGDADFAASEVRLIRHSGELVYWGRWGDRLIDGFWRPRDIDWSTYKPPAPVLPFPDHAPDCLKQKGALVSPSGAAQTFIRCTYGKEPPQPASEGPGDDVRWWLKPTTTGACRCSENQCDACHAAQNPTAVELGKIRDAATAWRGKGRDGERALYDAGFIRGRAPLHARVVEATVREAEVAAYELFVKQIQDIFCFGVVGNLPVEQLVAQLRRELAGTGA